MAYARREGGIQPDMEDKDIKIAADIKDEDPNLS